MTDEQAASLDVIDCVEDVIANGMDRDDMAITIARKLAEAGLLAATHVYVLEVGAYDSAGIAGVFSSPEKAMATRPEWTWTHDERWGTWSNGLDFDRAGIITRYTLDGEP